MNASYSYEKMKPVLAKEYCKNTQGNFGRQYLTPHLLGIHTSRNHMCCIEGRDALGAPFDLETHDSLPVVLQHT